MNPNRHEIWLCIVLLTYLLVLEIGDTTTVVVNFPPGNPDNRNLLVFPPDTSFLSFTGAITTEQGLILLAFAAAFPVAKVICAYTLKERPP